MILKPPKGAMIRRGHPSAKGLVCYPLMNEGGGNIVQDLSGNGNTGTLVGTAPSWSSGKFGPAIDLPGTDEYILIANESNFDMTDALTVSIWIYPRVSENGSLITKRGANAYYTNLYLSMTSNDEARFYLGNSTNNGRSCDISSSALALNTWHHILVIHNSVYASMYIDGQFSVGGNITDTIPTNDHQVTIGARSGDYHYPFDGLIDIPLIYNRALSASEIADLYRNPFGMFEEEF